MCLVNETSFEFEEDMNIFQPHNTRACKNMTSIARQRSSKHAV
jgi:hypothetical protein